MDLNKDSDLSDEEVFFGKLTLKEVKKHILMDLHQKNISVAVMGKKVSNSESTKIIQTSSQPDILSRRDIQDQKSHVQHLKSTSYPLINRQYDKPYVALPDLQIEDNFLEIEKEVNNHSLTPNKNNNLDNTLDIVDFILNHAQSYNEVNKKCVTNENISVADEYKLACDTNDLKDEILSQSSVENLHQDQVRISISGSPDTSESIKDEQVQINPTSSSNIKDNTATPFNTAISNKDKGLLENQVENVKSSPPPTLECIKDVKAQINSALSSNIATLFNTPMSNKSEGIVESQIKNFTLSSPTMVSIKNEQIQINTITSSNVKDDTATPFKTPILNKNKGLFENQFKNATLRSPTPERINDEKVQNNPALYNNIKIYTTTPVCTPLSNKGKLLNVFKTPNSPLSSRKETHLKPTPSRSRAYEHISSPIASYIKKCPQVPLVKDVYPKKPLPSTSSIPRAMKNGSENKMSNKENMKLPPLAYKSAKKTTVINTCIKKSLPNTWSQKLTSSLQKPTILKHDYRETKKKPLVSQQDSFANLSLHQADVSVCTQKYAFNKP